MMLASVCLGWLSGVAAMIASIALGDPGFLGAVAIMSATGAISTLVSAAILAWLPPDRDRQRTTQHSTTDLPAAAIDAAR